MAAAVVDRAELAGRALVLLEEGGDRRVEGVREDLRLGVVEVRGEVLEGGAQRGELTEGVPAQVVLLDELLHVLGRRAAGPRLEEAAAGEQRDDREHLGARAQLEDREEVGEVVTQDVARDRDGVLAGADLLEAEGHRVDGREDLDLEALGVVLRQVLLDLGDDLGVVGAGLVEEEDGRGTGRAGAGDGQLDPVLDGDVLDPAHPPDVALLDVVLEDDLTGRGGHGDGASRGDLEGRRVRAVLLRLLRHEADVGHGADRRGVEGAIALVLLEDGGVHRAVGAVGDHREGLLLGTLGVPHLAGVADDDRHRGVDDDVAGDVEVGDALVRVDHRQRGALLREGVDVGADRVAGLRRQRVELGVERGQAVAQVDVGLAEGLGVLVDEVAEPRGDTVAEEDGVGDLHHRRLEVQRQQQALGAGGLDLGVVEGAQRLGRHEGRVDDLPLRHRDGVLEDGLGAVLRRQRDLQGVVGGGHDGLLVAVEVALAHRGDAGLVVGGPRAELVRVLLREVLDRERGAAVGVALTQDGVDGGAEDVGVGRGDLLLLVGARVVRVVRQVVALTLELGDGRLELRHGGRDVGQLDDVGLGRLGELAETGEVVGDALLVGQPVGELGEDAAGERDVARLQLHTGARGEALDDREQRVGGQCRRLVDLGPDDLRGHVCPSVGCGVGLLRSSHGSGRARSAVRRREVTPGRRRGPGGCVVGRSG